ncbi:uncharacterized protein TRIADDRAFT_32828 [Trichoplax adhaerens]|uniref:J domain-containing protein n=1 Tax=Trichoplax adhaerens TaxID=10228 RepID=B3SBM6_TRIAD|nr:hypothetical protein TRIADDRAFT_32828 [Trichoplax adhaerens]EDV19888.1 hypothetical protein TRIADDRAFT_32828 [Trichoplax adhaerens]|eukprot:XP_002117630.1 hypothetical protein TRIADDRAFT_32828 [Trichoplax adhaerens]
MVHFIFCMTPILLINHDRLLYYYALIGVLAGSVDNHLELGKKFLATGKLQEALVQYHAAVDGDPKNYLTFFKRAIVYIGMEKGQLAVADLDRATEIRPNFLQAKLQRGKVHIKLGKLEKAQHDLEESIQDSSVQNEARQQLENIEPLRQTIANAKHTYASGDYEAAIQILNVAIESCPWDPELREMRAESHLAVNDRMAAIADVRRITRLTNDNTNAYYKLTKLLYENGDLESSLQQVRECLKLDPDHKMCFPFYKKVKKLNKKLQSIEEKINTESYQDAIPKLTDIMQTDVTQVQHYATMLSSKLCLCYLKVKDVNEGIAVCTDALKENENDIDLLCNRAELYLLNDEYDEAIADYQKAKSINNGNQRANEGLNRANRLLKQSQRRDYYKILDVKKTATKREILKAYRKLAVKWHPDNYKGEDKKKAEKMFIDIAAAKEVLSDAEKKQKFDNGEDPLSPEGQQPDFHNQGFHFQGGGFPFGGGDGFHNFKFHFGDRV